MAAARVAAATAVEMEVVVRVGVREEVATAMATAAGATAVARAARARAAETEVATKAVVGKAVEGTVAEVMVVAVRTTAGAGMAARAGEAAVRTAPRSSSQWQRPRH